METPDVDRAGYLGRTPTMADVIGWVFAVPTVIASLTLCPYVYSTIPRFEKMFQSLGGKLPAITIFVLGNGWWFFTLLPLAIATLSIVLLVRSEGQIAKILVPFLANQVVFGVAGTGVLAIFYPILELQKTLS